MSLALLFALCEVPCPLITPLMSPFRRFLLCPEVELPLAVTKRSASVSSSKYTAARFFPFCCPDCPTSAVRFKGFPLWSFRTPLSFDWDGEELADGRESLAFFRGEG